MSPQWYIARQGQKYGPYSFEQLQQWAGTGMLLPTEMVLGGGSAKWQTAGAVHGLFNGPPAAIPVASVAPSQLGHAAPPMQRAVVVGLAIGGCVAVLLCGGVLALVGSLKKPTEKPSEQVAQVGKTAPKTSSKEKPPSTGKTTQPLFPPPPSDDDKPPDHKTQPPAPAKLHHPAVMGVAFSPDGSLFASCARESGIILWDAKKGVEIRRLQCDLPRSPDVLYPFLAKEKGAIAVHFSQDGRHLFAQRNTVEVRQGKERLVNFLWRFEVASGKQTEARQIKSSLAVTFLPQTPLAILHPIEASGGSVDVYDVEKGQSIFQTAPPKYPGFDITDLFASYAVSKDGRLLFSSGRNPGGFATIHAIPSGEKLRTIAWPDNLSVRACQFTPDGGHVAILCEVGKKAEVRLVSTANGQVAEQSSVFDHELGPLPRLAVSDDGRLIAVAGSQSGDCALLTVPKLKPIPLPFNEKGAVSSIAFSPDSKTLALTTGDSVHLIAVVGGSNAGRTTGKDQERSGETATAPKDTPLSDKEITQIREHGERMGRLIGADSKRAANILLDWARTFGDSPYSIYLLEKHVDTVVQELRNAGRTIRGEAVLDIIEASKKNALELKDRGTYTPKAARAIIELKIRAAAGK